MSGVSKHTLEERFWMKVDKRGPGECWLWTATTCNGYGRIGTGNRITGVRNDPAHRVSYELAFGKIPADLVVDHKCHVRACVNPSHLQAVTYRENNENRAGAMPTSKSGIRGVRWHERTQTWQVYAKSRGKYYHGGSFGSTKEAEAAAIALRTTLMTNNLVDRGMVA